MRQSHRDELRGQLADAYRAADLIETQRDAVRCELDGLRQIHRLATTSQSMNVARVLETQRYEMVLQGQDAALAEKSKLVQQELERRRQRVAEAEREVKTLDKLEQKQEAAHRLETGRREAKEMDETAVTVVARRMAAGSEQS
jgi:flagellar export protein FliJ